MAYGLTSAGWNGKPTETIQAELDAGWRSMLGDSAGTEPDGSIPLDSLAGQEITILTDGFSGIWDLLQAIYSSFDPNQASGAQQDAVCSLTGTTREPETFSTVDATCTGTPLTVLTAGRALKTSDTGARFSSTADATITALTAWAALTAYVVGDRRTNANRCYICITAGTSAGSGGPDTTDADITDGTAHWKYLGEGTGAVDVEFEADDAGPVGALAGRLTEIDTPVAGWSSAVNLLDAETGAAEETDPALRARREAELAGQGATTVEAIRAAILKVNEGSNDPNHQPPKSCTVFYNPTDYTDQDGLPPHSVEILVQEGTDADIDQAVWLAVGGGTNMIGNHEATVTDSEGYPQTVRWSRPEEVLMYFVATVYYDESVWGTGASARVEEISLSALLTYAATIPIGLDQRALPLGGAILRGPAEVDENGDAVVPATDGSPAAPGLLDVDPIYIGTSPAPSTSTPVSITRRQIAVFDSTRCTITATSETP